MEIDRNMSDTEHAPNGVHYILLAKKNYRGMFLL